VSRAAGGLARKGSRVRVSREAETNLQCEKLVSD
jgi:hypothetical protein